MGRVAPSPAAPQHAAGGAARGLPQPRHSIHEPRIRTSAAASAAHGIEQVAGALRFPVALLGVILLFLAFQQRADRRDPKLASAPVASRQETLEFR